MIHSTFSFLVKTIIWSLDIAAIDLQNILARLNSTPYITQEVIWGAGEPIQPSEYVMNGELLFCMSLPSFRATQDHCGQLCVGDVQE